MEHNSLSIGIRLEPVTYSGLYPRLGVARIGFCLVTVVNHDILSKHCLCILIHIFVQKHNARGLDIFLCLHEKMFNLQNRLVPVIYFYNYSI